MKRKKIYIITFSGYKNYGSLLQATALNQCLKNLGYEVSMLGRWKVLSYMIFHPSLLLARAANKINAKNNKAFFNPSPYQISEARKKRNEKYREDNFKFEDIINAKDWREIRKDGDVFISGSDIIWQPANGYPSKYFLDFVYYTKLNRFSYASSFGATDLPHKYFRAYKKYLSKYTGVSIREKSATTMLEGIIGRKVYNAVDPTMLLTREQWDVYAAKAEFSKNIPDRYILCYFVMDDARYWDYVKKVAEATDLPVIVLPMHNNDEEQPYTIVDDATPYEFIRLIKDSKFVCTDSFHACVFSSIYEKEFYLLRRSRKDEDAKYDDFLTRYGLESRRIEDEKVFSRNTDIDYDQVQLLIDRDRKDSMKYLNNCLKGIRQ